MKLKSRSAYLITTYFNMLMFLLHANLMKKYISVTEFNTI